MADRVSEKILFISLGCDKNLADSEEMLGLLTENGYVLTDREDEADIIIINTCCFIHDAKEESIQTILEMAQWKESGRCRILAVTGCLAQRYQKEIMQEIPEVDLVLGTASTDAILEDHESFEICFIIDGEINITIDTVLYNLKQNDSVIIFPRQLDVYKRQAESVILSFMVLV